MVVNVSLAVAKRVLVFEIAHETIQLWTRRETSTAKSVALTGATVGLMVLGMGLVSQLSHKPHPGSSI